MALAGEARHFETKALSAALGAEIRGITLEQAVAPALFARIYAAFLEHQVLLFRGVDLPPATQVAFARRFGEVQVHVMNQYHGFPDYPEIYLLTNKGPDGRPSGHHPDKGTCFWHTDGSWRDRTGQATMMYAEAVPKQGGETHFADMYGAWETLPGTWRERISGLRAVHNLDFSRTRRHGEDPMTAAQRAAVPPVAHPMVRTHPETGRKCLFIGDHAEHVEGLAYDEGRAMIEALNALAIRDHLVYRHYWRAGDVMVWDNRCVLHRATPFDAARELRVMRRCTVLGEVPAP